MSGKRDGDTSAAETSRRAELKRPFGMTRKSVSELSVLCEILELLPLLCSQRGR